jgi:hypothetical protein
MDNPNEAYQKARLTQIDGAKFLFTPLQYSYSGTVGVQDETTSPQETFRLFVGRSPIGKIQANIRTDLAQKNIAIELADDIGKAALPIQFNSSSGPSLGTGTTGGSKIFHAIYLSDSGTVNSFYLLSIATIFFGSIVTADGKTHTVSFEQNMDGLYDPQIYGPISVWYYEVGTRKNLFSMSLPGA